MKVSGFTIIRNGVLYAYPFREAILSVLPLCDEFIVNVGKSDDNTLEIVKSINDERIKIFESEWDMNIREGGKVLSIETNKALQRCAGNWRFYIQSDEVLHEKYIPEVKSKMNMYLNDDKVEGLRFRYKHFYGSYDYIQDNYRKWYVKEVRVIKKNPDIVSMGDAMNFAHSNYQNLKVKDIDAEIYHYGWVRPPENLLNKRINFEKLYHGEEKVNEIINKISNYDDLGNLKRFTETHPKVMEEIIKKSTWNFDPKLDKQKPEFIRKLLIFLEPVLKRLKRNS
jgi:hypothetical protein